MSDQESTLKKGEYHPCADAAMTYIRQFLSDPIRLFDIKEALASTAISGNRTAQVCLATLERIEKSEPVSDRYLLGLAWLLRDFGEKMSDE